MEGPEIEGPQVWLDLNRKCETKIIGLINKNKERSAWLYQYLEDCKARLVTKCPEPEFVPKTPAQPKRGGRRGKASTAHQEQAADLSKTSTSSTRSNRTTRATRASRAAKRDVTVGGSDDADKEELDNANNDLIDDANNEIEVSHTPPPKKQSVTSPKPSVGGDKSSVVCAEIANATYSSKDSTEMSDVPNATFDVVNIPDATFDVGEEEVFVATEPVPGIDEVSNSKVDHSQVNSDENQFIEAEAVEKPQEVVNNIVEILKSTQKIDDNLSPIPAPRAINKVIANEAPIDEADSRPSRSTRTKQKLQPKDEAHVVDKTTRSSTNSDDAAASSSSRTKSKTASASSSASTGDEDQAPTRSTRTRQKDPPSTGSETDGSEDARPIRSTRTKQKQLAQSCSESILTKGAASPRVRELAAKVLSPALKQSSSTSRLPGGYTGSPVKDRVMIFENAMRDSAGLRSNKKAKRKSSISMSLQKASAARKIPIQEALAEQEVVVKKGPTIRKSPGVSNTSSLNNSRAPAGKVVRPGKKVFASGGRGVSPATGPRSGSHTGSSSNLMRSRSRLDIIERNKTTPNKNAPSNMVRGGLTSFLPAKPKGPTMQEIQEQKDEERRLKEQREIEAKQRREEQMRNKMEEKRLKNEERIKRVQEARQKQESIREDKMRKNHEKEKEDKLALLKKREENLKAEAEKRKKENELKLKEAEERRKREEEERSARMDKMENERREEERKKEEEQDQRRRKQDEERKRKLLEDEKRKRAEELKREELRQAEEKKRAAIAQQERIQREKEELRKLKEKEVARQADTTLNRTVTLDQSQAGVSSYDMTPARHELPPEPSQAEDNYGLDDLKSDEDTDDEDCPRKQVPKWAEGTQLRTSLLKQCYMGPDLDKIFSTIEMPDLSTMFQHQRKRFHKRTSSAVWETPPESFKHSKRW